MKLQVRFGAHVYPYTREVAWRHRFTIASFLTTVALIAWGGFVTSINAGLAVPDWPTSFNSFDPFNPWPEWWTITPVLAEHGHRLVGALVGIFTVILGIWTWISDPRKWMRYLGLGAIFLVSLQGTLGGLRVIWVSLDLAVVHAALAQVFFSLMAAMVLFTSRSWLAVSSVPSESKFTPSLRSLVVVTVAALYLQIILGALLRHPGTGINPLLAALHITGAFVSSGLVLATYLLVRWAFTDCRLLRKVAGWMFGLLGLQVLLGLTAYFVLIDEVGMLRPSNLQVIVNTVHLLIGAFLLASSVVLALLALRHPETVTTSDSGTEEPVLSANLLEHPRSN